MCREICYGKKLVMTALKWEWNGTDSEAMEWNGIDSEARQTIEQCTQDRRASSMAVNEEEG
jgi:hypothetical protein